MAKPVVNIGGIVLVFLLSLFAKLYFSQLEAAAFLCVSYMVYTAVKAVVTDNYSQVDMCWNISQDGLKGFLNNSADFKGLLLFFILFI